ncbi:MAG TPA: deoxyribose-phosphate aldolase [Candidatus Eisenbacteria bacterium]|nr:deoxyribose-phosphate aldolase [Candidatus Eisenbacteria bacterium]
MNSDVHPAAEIAGRIDHTMLDPLAVAEDVDRLCDEGVAWGFAAVCVNPVWVARCARRLRGSAVRVCSVAGFPLGAHLTEVKALEVRRAVEQGASEVDVVMLLSALQAGNLDQAREDLEEVVRAAFPASVKAILETGRLDPGRMVEAARTAMAAGATFVKTSTGFGPGATVDGVRLLRETVGPKFGVKASGGIRTLEQALAMLTAGATRLGTSAGVMILKEARIA